MGKMLSVKDLWNVDGNGFCVRMFQIDGKPGVVVKVACPALTAKFD